MPLIDYSRPHGTGSKSFQNLRSIVDDDDFDSTLQEAGDGLIVVDFSTTWCAPCRSMEGHIQNMADKFPKVLFLKVDADKCDRTAMKHDVTSVPLFVLYLNRMIIDRVKGASPQELEVKIRRNELNLRKSTTDNPNNYPSLLPPGPSVVTTVGKLGDITEYFDRRNCHCICDLTPTPFHSFMDGKKLVAGKGIGRINLVYSLTQKMKLQAFKIRAPLANGPKTMRVFVNQPKVLDFQSLSTMESTQDISLTDKDLAGEHAIEFKSSQFELVTNFQVFISENMSKSRHTEIEVMKFYGAPVTVTIEPPTDAVLEKSLPMPSTSKAVKNAASTKYPKKH